MKRRHDVQHDDTQHNDIHHNDTQYNDTQHNDTQPPTPPKVILLVLPTNHKLGWKSLPGTNTLV